MKTSEKAFEAIEKLRNSVFEFLGTAVVLALGINIFSSGFTTWLDINPVILILIGGIVCIAGVAIFLIRFGPANHRSLDFEGAILLHRDSPNEVIPIFRYDLSESLASNMSALCSENRALARVWKDATIGAEIGKKNPAHELITEGIEYFAINKLSLLLSEYFNDDSKKIDKNRLVVYEREDVPRILLRNRFLEMFSRPMEEREAFMKPEDIDNARPRFEGTIERGGNGTEHGKVVMSWGPNGEIFDLFELTLPKNTRIDRSADHVLEISNPQFTIKIKSEFEGYGFNLPHNFEHHYLGKHLMAIDAYQCNLKLEVKFKLRAFLSGSGRQYHQWIDRYLSDMESSFSFDQFIKEISWEAAESTAIALFNSRRRPEGVPDWLAKKETAEKKETPQSTAQ